MVIGILINSCSPAGYMQSPRVIPGFEISTTAAIDQEKNESTIDPTHNFGISDRVRLSSGASFFGADKVFSEVMVNLVDRGEPNLFKNIAVGTLLSGNIMRSDNSFYYKDIDTKISKQCQAGVLISTGTGIVNTGVLELIGGVGVSHKRNIYYFGYNNPYKTKPLDGWFYYESGEINSSQFLADFAGTVKMTPSRGRRFSAYAGAVVSVLLQDNNWFSGEYYKYQIDSSMKSFAGQQLVFWRIL